MLSLLYLTLALVWIGGLGIFAVTGESLYDAFWQVTVLIRGLLQFYESFSDADVPNSIFLPFNPRHPRFHLGKSIVKAHRHTYQGNSAQGGGCTCRQSMGWG